MHYTISINFMQDWYYGEVIQSKLFQNIKQLFERYERHISSAGLIVGFLVDSITFQRIDLWFENLVLFFYISIAGSGIAIINLYEEGRVRGMFFDFLSYWAPLLVQYAFGGLFSGFVIFYFSSASWGTNALFLLVLLGVLVGNEFFKKRYLHFGFPVSVFFLALFSFFIFYIPIVLGNMGAWVFLLSGLASLVAIGLFIYSLSLAIPKRVEQNKALIFKSIAGIYAVVNILYFLNIIPPIPLSLKEAGIYHSVIRVRQEYEVTREQQEWFAFLFPSETIRVVAGKPVYAYSAVFAPTRLQTTLFHHWQYYDEANGAWVTANRVSFPMVGGRDGGYRGFSLKTNVFPGRWRVDVETARGQIIGRLKFKVEFVTQNPPLEESVR